MLDLYIPTQPVVVGRWWLPWRAVHTEACPEENAGDHVGVAIGIGPAVSVSGEVSQFEQRSSIEQCFVVCTRRGEAVVGLRVGGLMTYGSSLVGAFRALGRRRRPEVFLQSTGARAS